MGYDMNVPKGRTVSQPICDKVSRVRLMQKKATKYSVVPAHSKSPLLKLAYA
jgi:hypothetical protein